MSCKKFDDTVMCLKCIWFGESENIQIFTFFLLMWMKNCKRWQSAHNTSQNISDYKDRIINDQKKKYLIKETFT